MPRSLELLSHQPYRFGFTAETCANNDNRAYCNLVEDGDTISFQVRRIMGTSLGCDLTDVDGTQLLANSGFTGAAAPEWTLSGGWTYGADAVSNAGGNGSVSQTYAGMVDNTMYKIDVTTTATTTGADLEVFLSGTVRGVIPVGSVAGTYTFYSISDTGVSSTVGVQGTGITTTVTSIEMYTAAPCFTFNVTEGTVTFDEDNGLVVSGSVGIAVTLPFETSNTYSPHVEIDFADVQGGSIVVTYDSDVSATMPISNGTFEWTSNGRNFTTYGIGLTDFIGNINNISFEQYSSDYFFSLYDLDGVFVQSLNNYITYCRDTINLSLDPQAEGITYGCYRMGIYDPFQHADYFEASYDFTTLGAPWTETGTAWTLTGGVGYEFDAAGNTNAFAETLENTGGTYAVAWVKMKFETVDNTGAGIGASSMGISLVDPSGPSTVADSQITSPGVDTIHRYSSEGTPVTTYGATVEPNIYINGALAGDHYEFVNAFYKIYPYHLDYTSNCFNYRADHPCSKVIYAVPHNDLGFNTDNCPFAIQQRFRIVRITPHYLVQGSDFISSDGTRYLVSGTMQKVSVLLFDYMDEISHDVVAAILMSRTIYIGDTVLNINNDGIRYFALAQNYTPEWEKNGKLNLAMGRIEIIEYDQVKFSTNCE